MKERFEQNPNYHKEWRQKNKERIKEQRKKISRKKPRENKRAVISEREKKIFD
jgi:hypothetical protein